MNLTDIIRKFNDPRHVRILIILAVVCLFILSILYSFRLCQRILGRSPAPLSQRRWRLCLSLAFVSIGILVFSSIVMLMLPPVVISPQLPVSTPLIINPTYPLTITFNRPVSQHLTASIDPPVQGQWRLKSSAYGPFLPDQLQFVPDQDFLPATEYQISLKSILPIAWINLSRQSTDYLFVFNTPPSTSELAKLSMPSPTPTPIASTSAVPTPIEPSPTPGQFRLNVPLFSQHHTFTCYAVAAKMALAYRDVKIDEVGFLQEIGYDRTPRNYVTNTWGDPYQGVVGTYDGSGEGGYGANWPPVAKAMSKYRKVEIKENWSLSELLKTVSTGNPVMVWWVNGVWPAKDMSWNNAQGEKVYTVNGMHVEVVTGWVGNREKPDYILTNDPWRGLRRYSPQSFLNLWRWFHNSAVIVY